MAKLPMRYIPTIYSRRVCLPLISFFGDTERLQYLIRDGVPINNNYSRVGSVSVINADGELLTFPENTPPIVDGELLSIGQRTNTISESIDFSLWDLSSIAVPLGGFADPSGGMNAYKITPIGPGSFLRKFITQPLTNGCTSIWVKGGSGSDSVISIKSTSVGNLHNITEEWQEIVFCTDASDRLQIGDIEGTFFIYQAQLTDTKYPISPFVIPTDGAPVTTDTSAASASDDHGLTWDLTEPENKPLLEVLDGRVDGEELITPGSLAKYFDGNNQIISNGDGSYTLLQDLGGTVFSPPLNLQVGGRYENTLTVIAHILGGVKVIDGSSTWNQLNGAGAITTRRVITDGTVDTRRASPNTDIELTFTESVRKISPANGIITLEVMIVPELGERVETAYDMAILSIDSRSILYVQRTTGEFKISDGVSSRSSAVPYIAGTKQTVSILMSADGYMRIDVDGIKGTAAAFTGTLIDGSEKLKFALGNEDLIKIDNFSVKQGLLKMPEEAVPVYGELPASLPISL